MSSSIARRCPASGWPRSSGLVCIGDLIVAVAVLATYILTTR
jgi:hypothetical protein